MKLIKNYNDYFGDNIFESLDEFKLIISPVLKKILNTIDHPISNALIHDDYNERLKKVTYIDIVYGEYDKWSFVISNKLLSTVERDYKKKSQNDTIEDIIYDNNTEIINKIKSNIKITRLINKIYPNKFPLNGKPGEDIESFITEYKSIFQNDNNIQIVEGEDIIKWYNVENNITYPYGPLQNSCMRYPRCGEYLKFYSINSDKIRLVILLDENDESNIRSRALLWKLDSIDGKNVSDTYFMDRIYFTTEMDLLKMLNYAKNNNFLYKSIQNSDTYDYIIDPSDNSKSKKILVVNDINYHPNILFPFVDTLSYYDPFNKILTNKVENKNLYGDLSGTNGKTNIIFSERYNELIIVNRDNYTWSNLSKEYLKNEDVIIVLDEDGYIDIVHKDSDDYVYSKEEVKNIMKDQSVYSLPLDDYIFKKHSVIVYTDKLKKHFYYLPQDKLTSTYYTKNGINYDNSVTLPTNWYNIIK